MLLFDYERLWSGRVLVMVVVGNKIFLLSGATFGNDLDDMCHGWMDFGFDVIFS